MTRPDLEKLLNRMALAVANKPDAGKVSLLMESILDNRLTDEEIRRGYIEVRDKEKPWWPSPGEFLALARPPVSSATVSGEAETIFQSLIDRPHLYGDYNPNGPRVYERRRVQSLHGPAAGMAFAAVASRFRNLEEESVPFVRRDFVSAYEDARKDLPAPLTLDPARVLGSRPEAAPLLSGATEPKEEGENLRKLREMIRGGFREPSGQCPDAPRVDPVARVAELRRQAEEIGRESGRA